MQKTITIIEQKDGRIKVAYQFTCDRLSGSERADYDFESFEASERADDVRLPVVGYSYMLGLSEYVGHDTGYDHHPVIAFESDNGAGWSGNSNIYRYHGWMGTTNNWSFCGYGVRRCLAIRRTGRRSQRVVIVFGRDLQKGKP